MVAVPAAFSDVDDHAETSRGGPVTCSDCACPCCGTPAATDFDCVAWPVNSDGPCRSSSIRGMAGSEDVYAEDWRAEKGVDDPRWSLEAQESGQWGETIISDIWLYNYLGRRCYPHSYWT